MSLGITLCLCKSLSFEAAFSAGLEELIDVVFFADVHGCLSGIDIH